MLKKLSEIKIIEDSRNKVGAHDIKNQYFREKGIMVLRSKLPFGDYALMDNMSISVDTKESFLEIENNLTKQHTRFRNEIINANNFFIILIFTVKNSIMIKLIFC